MIIFYDKTNFDIKIIYKDSAPSLEVLREKDPEFYENYSSMELETDMNVINNGSRYRLVTYEGTPIVCAPKPDVKLTLSKDEIVSNGEDSAVLTITIENAHYLDNIITIPILLNETETNVDIVENTGQIEITSLSEGEIEIKVNSNKFICDPIELDVI